MYILQKSERRHYCILKSFLTFQISKSSDEKTVPDFPADYGGSKIDHDYSRFWNLHGQLE